MTARPDPTREQARIVFDNIGRILAAHGGGPNHIVKLTWYFCDLTDRAVVIDERDRFLGDHTPASTAVAVAGLVRPDLRFEVDVVAAVPAGSGA